MTVEAGGPFDIDKRSHTMTNRRARLQRHTKARKAPSALREQPSAAEVPSNFERHLAQCTPRRWRERSTKIPKPRKLFENKEKYKDRYNK